MCEEVGFLLGRFVFGAVDDFLCGVVVEGEVVVEPGLVFLLGVDVLPVEVVGVVLWVEVDVVGGGALWVEVVGAGVGLPHDSEIDLTGAERLRDDSGAPWGSWKYSVCPVTSVTVTVHVLADAAGNAATPRKAAVIMAVASAILSLPRPSTFALSPPDISNPPTQPRHDGTAGVLWASY